MVENELIASIPFGKTGSGYDLKKQKEFFKIKRFYLKEYVKNVKDTLQATLVKTRLFFI